MIRLKHLLHAVALGVFLSTVGYMYFFHSGVKLERWAYLILSVGILSLSTLISSLNKLNFLAPLVLTGIACSIAYSILYVFFSIYKEIYAYSPFLEIVLLSFTALTFLVFFFHQKPSLVEMRDQLQSISVRPFLSVLVIVSVISFLLKIGVGYMRFDNYFFDFLNRTSDTLWVVWSYVLLPVISGALLLLFCFKVCSEK